MSDKSSGSGIVAFLVLAFLVVSLVAGLMVGIPTYRVWSMEMDGRAQLKQAEYTKQIAVEESRAKLESAKFLNQAEVERAKGVAEANEIIGQSLKGNTEYLRYLWIQGLQEDSNKVIYIPTEAGLPILEAGKR